MLPFRRTGLFVAFQEDRRKIPEGASLGLYREDGKEHRKPVYKQVEPLPGSPTGSKQPKWKENVQNLCFKVDGSFRLHFNSDGQWVVSRLGSPIPGLYHNHHNYNHIIIIITIIIIIMIELGSPIPG